MTKLPKISSYGNYSSNQNGSSNYGTHTLKVEFGNIELYFSYETIVAFSAPKYGLVVRENDWGTTTGKHLKWIDGGDKEAKANRLPSERFEAQLKSFMEEHNLEV